MHISSLFIAFALTVSMYTSAYAQQEPYARVTHIESQETMEVSLASYQRNHIQYCRDMQKRTNGLFTCKIVYPTPPRK